MESHEGGSSSTFSGNANTEAPGVMKIAITNPTTWPRVRRGGERFLNELARYLAQKGHEVTVISSKPGAKEVTDQSGYTTVCHRRLWHPILAKIGVLEFHAFFLSLLPSLLRKRYDVVTCCTFLDTYAAILARKVTGAPCVFWVNSLPPRVRYFRSVTLGGAVIRRAMRNADEVIALSGYMQSCLQLTFNRAGIAIPIPVDTDRFAFCESRDHVRPIILCAAALDDQRKGGSLLMKAFDQLKRIRPEPILQVASAITEETRAKLLALVSPLWRNDVQFLGEVPDEGRGASGRLDDLPSVFGRAAVSVLPSLWESFGAVILESMATGTPVVGTRDGAIPELISSPEVGRLFDPGPTTGAEPTNLDGLVQAMLEALDLSREPQTAFRCRAHADQFSWGRIGPRFEELYDRLLSGKSLTRLQVGVGA